MLGLSDIFLTGPVPPTALIGHYAPWLVFVSFVLIGLAGMIGFDMVAFGLQRDSRIARLTWRGIAAVTLGVGIWSMHFLAMLAYQQGLDMEYDPLGSAVSVLSAVVIIFLGLGLVDRPAPSLARVFGFGGVITVAILVMHSIGMAAMDMAMDVRYRPEWIAFGAVVGAPAALAAAWFAFRLAPSLDKAQSAARTAAAAMLALSVCGLHYAAIEGTVMIPLDGLCADFTRNGLNLKLVFAVAAGTLGLLTLAIMAAMSGTRYSMALQSRISAQNRALIETNTQLEQARDEAESASRAKSDFLSMMSHEIRTPLNLILGNAELMRDAGLSDDAKGRLTEISQAAETLFGIHAPIFDMMQLEAGTMQLAVAPFEPARLLAELSDFLVPRAGAKGLSVTAKIAGDLPPALAGDAARIRQIVTAMLTNALKFTSTGSIALETAVAPIGESRSELSISVIDTGCGIDLARSGELFTAFRQADGSDTRRHGGIGMGLTISLMLAQLMGGRIDVDSRPGEGSRFTLVLPLDHAALPAAAESAAPPVAAPEPAALRLMVVDDQPGNLSLLVLLLKKLGYARIDTACNGIEAVALARENAYDAILMDCQMPEMDGFDATQSIRVLEAANSGRPSVIIAVTADTMRSTREKCIDAGMDDYLNKPISKQSMQACLAKWRLLQAAG